MPLNINDNGNEDCEKDHAPKSQPVLHQPGESASNVPRWLIGLGIGGMLLLAAFLMIQYNVLNLRPGLPPEARTLPSPVGDTAAVATAQTGTLPARKMDALHNPYTIYISSYKKKSDASEEVGRWVNAGYTSFVYETAGWNRVALGRYDSPRRARVEAESLKVAFENGYWIGTAQ